MKKTPKNDLDRQYRRGQIGAFHEAAGFCREAAAKAFLDGSDQAAVALRSMAVRLAREGVVCQERPVPRDR